MRHCSTPTNTALLALLAVACAPPEQPEEVAVWTIDPVIAIGVADGDPMQEFGRVAHAMKLSDGRIAIADMGNTEVRVFNPNGTHTLTIGRRGNGPGEFPSLARLAVLQGDTILAGGAVRMNKYMPSGSVVAHYKMDWTVVERAPLHIEAAHPLAHGHYLLYLVRSSTGQPANTDLHRTDNLYMVWRGSLQDSDTLGFFPGLEQMRFTENNTEHTAVPLFPASTTHAINRDWIVVADLGSDSVLRYDVERGRSRWIKLPLVRQPLGDSALAVAEATACDWASADADRHRCEAALRKLPPQTHYPEMAAIAVDTLGLIWVRTYPLLQRGYAEWRIFDEDGIALARIAIPASVRITQIGEDYIVGITTDDQGVQRVVEYELARRILDTWKGPRIVPREEYR